MKRLIGLAVLFVVAFGALVAWCWADAQRRDLGDLLRRTPKRTALMNEREREARAKGRTARVDQRTVSYSQISPVLRRAVLVAEDDAFFQHEGLDWNEIRASARKNWEEKKVARGGSTVTQQLAKNLYLGSSRNPVRKLTEVFLAMRLERALSKRRIFELYLNLIEWGDGVYGIEAASRHYFGVPASALGPRQAVLLAAVIINPRRYSVLDPPKRILNRARMIAKRLHRRGLLDDREYHLALGEPWNPPVDSLAVAADSLTPAALPESVSETPAIEEPPDSPAPTDTIPQMP